jgi:PAS domain S-box-containing protein
MKPAKSCLPDTVTEQLTPGIAQVSRSGHFWQLNQTVCDILGYPRDDLLKLSLADIIHPDDWPRDLEARQQLLAGERDSYTLELRCLGADHRPVWVSLTGSLLPQPQGPSLTVLIVMVDITPLKQLQQDHEQVVEALATSKSLYKKLLTSLADAVLLTDETGALTFVSPNVEAIWGMTRTEVQAMNTIEAVLGTEFFTTINLNQIKAAGELNDHPCQIRDAAGNLHTLLVTIKAVNQAEGSWLYSCRDITDRTQFENALKLYTQIAHTTQDFMALVDCDYRYRLVNDAYARWFRLPKAAIVGHTAAELVGEDTFQTVLKPRLNRCLAGETVEFQQQVNFDDGAVHHLDIRYTPYRDDDNRITGIVVNAHDITALKEAEAVLAVEARRAEALLAMPQASETLSEHEFMQYGRS